MKDNVDQVPSTGYSITIDAAVTDVPRHTKRDINSLLMTFDLLHIILTFDPSFDW